MMIPQIARKLLNEYRPEGHFGLLFDPYMGSGTSLVEASVQGIDSVGTDINPLACLIAEVKTTRSVSYTHLSPSACSTCCSSSGNFSNSGERSRCV